MHYSKKEKETNCWYTLEEKKERINERMMNSYSHAIQFTEGINWKNVYLQMPLFFLCVCSFVLSCALISHRTSVASLYSSWKEFLWASRRIISRHACADTVKFLRATTSQKRERNLLSATSEAHKYNQKWKHARILRSEPWQLQISQPIYKFN